jgi:hypothetical protein
MRHVLTSAAKLCRLAIGLALPLAAQSAGGPPGPCEQVVAACMNAGFVKGDARAGFGLWTDCIDPIMRGVPQPPRADKPLPAVPPDMVAACRQIRPNFGEGRKGQPH